MAKTKLKISVVSVPSVVKGFSLVELMIVVAVLGILAALFGVSHV